MTVELIILNTIAVVYLAYTLYLCKKCDIKEEARHHIISHNWIVVFLVSGINGIVIYNDITPYSSWVLLYGLLHVSQHLTKENIRLAKTNDWVKNA